MVSSIAAIFFVTSLHKKRGKLSKNSMKFFTLYVMILTYGAEIKGKPNYLPKSVAELGENLKDDVQDGDWF